MFFEGSEKKVEVIVNSDESLRARGYDFWCALVERAQAKILSKISSHECDAYLLSESSLFVWNDRFVLITCGQTTLVESILFFLKSMDVEKIAFLIYERKNEYFPHLQHSDFYEDVERLKPYLKGRAFRFGRADEHHLFLFEMNKPYLPSDNDCTLELLMHDIQGSAQELFLSAPEHSGEVRRTLGLETLFSDFQLDDYLFRPYGYSVNGLRGGDYYTIHVTPQETGSYASFESNLDITADIQPAIHRMLNVFKPRAFDCVVFNPNRFFDLEVPSYRDRKVVKQGLSSGYFVSYLHFSNPQAHAQAAFEIGGQSHVSLG